MPTDWGLFDLPDPKTQGLMTVEATGGFDTLLLIAHDWDEREKWLRSMDLLTHQVAPALPSL